MRAARKIVFAALVATGCQASARHGTAPGPTSPAPQAASVAPVTTPASTTSGAPVASHAKFKAVPAQKIMADWIVREQIARGESRYLLVRGLVPRGAEQSPPIDATYTVVRAVDEAFARESKLAVRSLTVPHFYTLPEPFTVEIVIDTDPPGARLYEIAGEGALVPYGSGLQTLTFEGAVSDLSVSVAGSTWLAPAVQQDGIKVGFWAATDDAVSTPDLSPTWVPLLTGADLAALRSGARKITKRFTIRAHTPVTPQTSDTLSRVVVILVP